MNVGSRDGERASPHAESTAVTQRRIDRADLGMVLLVGENMS
jgi:hypothetical protein